MYSKSVQKEDFLNGVLWKQVLYVFFPILFGSFFQQLYTTVDAIIVGQYLGKQALAAVGGSTGNILNLLISFFVGLSSGASIIIAQQYGAKHYRAIRKSVHTAMALAFAGGFIFTVFGILFSKQALILIDNPQDIMKDSLVYLRIMFMGMIPTLVYNMGSSILRAVGDSKSPFYYLIVASVANIVLDFLFIAIIPWGVAGAAIATVVSQIISALLIMIRMMKVHDTTHVCIKYIGFTLPILGKIIKIGFPAGLQAVLCALTNIFVQTYVNRFGTDSVAAVTVFGRIGNLYWMMIHAYGIAIMTVAGQNYGAQKLKRVKDIILQGMVLSGISTIILCTIYIVAGRFLFSLFTNDSTVISIGLNILYMTALTYILYNPIEVVSSTLRSTGDVFMPTVITLTGICLVTIIWIWGMIPIVPRVEIVMASYPVSWIATSLMFYIYYRFFSKFWKQVQHITQ